MRLVKRLALGLAILYSAACVFLVFAQRRLMYDPDVTPAIASTQDLPGLQIHRIQTQDGESLAAWYVPPATGKRLYLYLHGNSGNLAGRTRRFNLMTADGSGLLAIDWRGYGGSTGAPTEDGLNRDADAAYADALRLVGDPQRIVIVGESLGTGLAVPLAARSKATGLILDSAFSSMADVAADRYWIFPTRWLVLDQYRSDLAIGQVHTPILALHGDADRVVPFRLGERLFLRAAQPKEFVRVPGADHLVLALPSVLPRVQAWVAKLGGS